MLFFHQTFPPLVLPLLEELDPPVDEDEEERSIFCLDVVGIDVQSGFFPSLRHGTFASSVGPRKDKYFRGFIQCHKPSCRQDIQGKGDFASRRIKRRANRMI